MGSGTSTPQNFTGETNSDSRDSISIQLRKTSSLDAISPHTQSTSMQQMGGLVPGKGTRAMYCGGAFGLDGHLYIIPKNSPRAARFDPVTATWQQFGDMFPEGGNKWVCAAVSNFDGCIYSFPGECNLVSHVLQIDPTKKEGAAKKVGGSVLELADGVTSWPWHGTVAAADGCVYAIPYNAKSVLRFDPRTRKLSTFGQLGPEPRKYVCGVLGEAGRYIFCVPKHAARVLRIDTKTSTCELIGKDLDGTKNDKWCGAAMGGDGIIYCIPRGRTVDRVLCIDPWSKTTSLFGDPIQVKTGWWGAVSGADGCVYSSPHISDRVLRVDPFTNTASMVGETIPYELGSKLRHAVLGPDGAIWCLPYHLPSRILRVETPSPGRHTPLLTRLLQPSQHQKLCQGLADPPDQGPALATALHWEATRPGGDHTLVNRLLEKAAPALPACVLVKQDGHARVASLALRALAAAMSTTKVNSISETLPGLGGQYMYSGGAFGSDGWLYLIPRNAPVVARFDPRTNTWETFGSVFAAGGDKWVDAVVSSVDGCIYSFPCECSVVPFVLKIDPQNKTVQTVGANVLELAPGVKNYPWHSMVEAADGCIYGFPHTASTILRFDPRTEELSTFGDLGDDAVGSRYFSGVVGPAGRYIYCPPANASRVLCVDTNTLTCELIGDDFGRAKIWKWYGGGMAGDGAIYCIPLFHNRVIRIDPATKTASLFGPVLDDRAVAWRGGNAAADGCIYGTPHKADRVLRIDPFAGTVATIGPAIPKEFDSMLFMAAPDSSGSLWCMPLHLPCGLLKITPPEFSLPLAPLRALITNPPAFQRCLYVDSLREVIVPMLVDHARLNKHAASGESTVAVTTSQQSVSVVADLQKHRPEILAALEALRALPLPVAMEHGDRFVSYFAASSAIRLAAAPNAWCPLPSSVDGWAWPPPPLVPIRAACKIARDGGPAAVEAAWPALSQCISRLLVVMVDAVRANLPLATKLLTTVFTRERDRSLDTYRRQLRRARRDPTYPEFKEEAKQLKIKITEIDRKKQRVQTIPSFPKLYAAAYGLYSRFVEFMEELSRRCARSTALGAPIKGCGRAMEKLILNPGIPEKLKSEGANCLDARHLVDVVRGSIRCPDFTEITFVLELLHQLDVELGDPGKAKAAGIDLEKFQIVIIHIKDRFTTPTSGGWADCMINFRFAKGDDTRHVMELQLQHEQMLVVRREGKAHHRYNSFRSAIELLETVGEAPHDSFVETPDDQSPLENLQLQLKQMQHQLTKYESNNKSLLSLLNANKAELEKSQTQNRSLRQHVDTKLAQYQEENARLLSRVQKLETDDKGFNI